MKTKYRYFMLCEVSVFFRYISSLIRKYYPALLPMSHPLPAVVTHTDAEDASSTDTAQSFLDNASAGSGMYILTSYTPDEEVVLEKNPNYWGTSTNVDKYILKIQPDANTQMMTLSTGDIDVALNLTDDTLEELGSAENVEIVNGTTKMNGFVMMNMNEESGEQVTNQQVPKQIRKE